MKTYWQRGWWGDGVFSELGEAAKVPKQVCLAGLGDKNRLSSILRKLGLKSRREIS
jgi:hypothetical protein